MVLWKNIGGVKQKHKKQPFSDASASHLSLVLWHVWFQAGAWISHTTPLTPPSCEVGGIAKRTKTARLRRKTNPVGTWYFTSAYNCITILIINHLARTRSIASLPSKIVFWRVDTTSFHWTVSPWIGAFLVGVGNKKRPDFSSRVFGFVGVDGFEPPTLCL